MRTIRLTVQRLRQLIREASGPEEWGTKFSLEVFRDLTDHATIEDYLMTWDTHFREGSGRIVFDVGESYVIKLARQYTNGVKENKREAGISSCAPPGAPVVQVIDAAPDYLWIACTKVEPITGAALNQAVKATVGLADHQDLMDVIDAGVMVKRYPNEKDKNFPEDWVELVPKHEKLHRTNEWYRALFDTVVGCRLMPGELHEGNWGLDENGDLVLLDAGT